MMRVFIADDEEIIRDGIRNCIEKEQGRFLFAGEAPDGEMALPMLIEMKPDVLITDIRMPFMDGLELAKVVRRTMPWLRIIFLSGHDEFEYAQKAVSLHADAYLLKPIRSAQLVETLEQVAAPIEQAQMLLRAAGQYHAAGGPAGSAGTVGNARGHKGLCRRGAGTHDKAVLSPSEYTVQRRDQPCKGVYPEKLCGQRYFAAYGRGGGRIQSEPFFHRVFAGNRTDFRGIPDRRADRGGKTSADGGQQPYERYCVRRRLSGFALFQLFVQKARRRFAARGPQPRRRGLKISRKKFTIQGKTFRMVNFYRNLHGRAAPYKLV